MAHTTEQLQCEWRPQDTKGESGPGPAQIPTEREAPASRVHTVLPFGAAVTLMLMFV